MNYLHDVLIWTFYEGVFLDELILSDLHSLDLILVVKPHSLTRLFDGFENLECLISPDLHLFSTLWVSNDLEVILK